MRLIRCLWCRLGCIKSGSVFCWDPFRSLPAWLNGKYQAPFTHTNTTYLHMQSHSSQKRAWRSCVLVLCFKVKKIIRLDKSTSSRLISLKYNYWFFFVKLYFWCVHAFIVERTVEMRQESIGQKRGERDWQRIASLESNSGRRRHSCATCRHTNHKAISADQWMVFKAMFRF